MKAAEAQSRPGPGSCHAFPGGRCSSHGVKLTLRAVQGRQHPGSSLPWRPPDTHVSALTSEWAEPAREPHISLQGPLHGALRKGCCVAWGCYLPWGRLATEAYTGAPALSVAWGKQGQPGTQPGTDPSLQGTGSSLLSCFVRSW